MDASPSAGARSPAKAVKFRERVDVFDASAYRDSDRGVEVLAMTGLHAGSTPASYGPVYPVLPGFDSTALSPQSQQQAPQALSTSWRHAPSASAAMDPVNMTSLQFLGQSMQQRQPSGLPAHAALPGFDPAELLPAAQAALGYSPAPPAATAFGATSPSAFTQPDPQLQEPQPYQQQPAGATVYAPFANAPYSATAPPPPPPPPPPEAYVFDATTHQPVLASDPAVVRDLQQRGHSVMALTDAHRAKLTEVSVLANTALATRRDALMQQRARVAARVAEVRAARATIERGTHSLVDDMLSRLRAAEQRKISALEQQAAELDAQLAAHVAFQQSFARAAAPHNSALDYLLRHAELAETAQRLAEKPYEDAIDVNADDLPTEAADAADAHERLKALSQLLSVKDTLIAHLLQDRDGLRAKVARLEASASAAAAQAPQQLGLEDDAAAAAEAGRLQQQLRRQARETLLATLASKSGSVDRGVGPDA